MDGLLTPVSTSYRSSSKDSCEALTEVPTTGDKASSHLVPVTTPEKALDILRNEPDYQIFISTLGYLSKGSSSFCISLPSPISAQLVHVLVSVSVPTYWDVITATDEPNGSKTRARGQPSSELQLLISCLQSVTGLNAVALCLKQLVQLSKGSTRPTAQGPSIQEVMRIWLNLLEVILQDEDLFMNVWNGIYINAVNPRGIAVWKEFLKIIGSGKIIGISAEAEEYVQNLSKNINKKHWVADGNKYSLWLAHNIARWVKYPPDTSEACLKGSRELISKSLCLGYTETIIKAFITDLLLQNNDFSMQFIEVLSGLSNSEQRKILFSIIKICSKDYLSYSKTNDETTQWWESDKLPVSAVAALIDIIVSDSDVRKSHLVTWLSSSAGAGVGDGIAIRRSIMAAVASDKSYMEKVLEKCLQQFSDPPYIKHVPTLQQDVHCQVLLLAAGYVNRQSPMQLKFIMRSGMYLSLVSNRLSASSSRVRFLGMVVGEALSDLVDKEENKMNFKVPDMETSEAKWFKSLVRVCDSVGPFGSLRSMLSAKDPMVTETFKHRQPAKLKALTTKPKIITREITEINVEESSTEDADINDMVPYSKPDLDAEDSDDDPTLITRNKSIAPVYIRDLITYLRDTDSYERQRLGLSTAAQLIRRKANFGTEVIDHAEELATLLVGIQDKFKIENFADMRLQGMIAILIALPSKMGRWFSNTFFAGDYSISQRSSILTTLGLGAREIGGFSAEDSLLSSNQTPVPLFPSKTLPANMESHYAPVTATQVDAVSSHLARTMIAPLAASVADKLTGPSILKVRTFSSRLEVQKKSPKPTANPLSKIVAEGFVFPLIGRFSLQVHSHMISTRSVIFQPYLLSHFIKTLSLIIHASGPYTPSLPQITAEFWDLLLGLRVSAQDDRSICEALCFAFLTILELNADRAVLVQVHGSRLLETQDWIRAVLQMVGEGDEDERCGALATGCLIKIQEIVQKHQKMLLSTP